MESIEFQLNEIAKRISLRDHRDSVAHLQSLMADPTFRRLMRLELLADKDERILMAGVLVEELKLLVKVDMEPVDEILEKAKRFAIAENMDMGDEESRNYTNGMKYELRQAIQDQLTAAVLKEREECAKVFDKLSNIASYQPEDIAQMIRSRTERTE